MNLKIITLLLFFVFTVYGQIVYEPLHRDIYQYLSRLAQKGIIELDDQVKPISRIYIAGKLLELDQNILKLTPLEKDELSFYKTDFDREIRFLMKEEISGKELSVLRSDHAGRKRLFSYTDNFFHLNLSPIFGYKIGSRDNAKATHFWNGTSMYGYIGNNIGVSFDFRDNNESGTTIDKFKEFTPVPGTNETSDRNILNYSATKIEYTEAKTVITANWNWGSAAIGKEFFEWGYGEGGKIVLSRKAPSFPFIRLDAQPVEWLSFNYIHGWLASDVLDSTDFYPTSLGSMRKKFRTKYLATHSLTFKPVKGLDISLGESVVYSDRFEFVYFIPVMFFKLADHYISRHNNSVGDNTQLFASVSSRNHLPNTHLYASLFIDEITITNIFNSERQRNHLGFTLGSSIVDLPINNLSLTLEYSKIFPFVYNHFIQTTTYQSASYDLGHWMGDNADQIYASLEYRFFRGLKTKFWTQYIRKGDRDITKVYTQPQPPFLFGLRKNYSYFGGAVQYEFLHELFAKLEFQTTKSSVQQEDQSFIDKTLNEFYFSVYYGL